MEPAPSRPALPPKPGAKPPSSAAPVAAARAAPPAPPPAPAPAATEEEPEIVPLDDFDLTPLDDYEPPVKNEPPPTPPPKSNPSPPPKPAKPGAPSSQISTPTSVTASSDAIVRPPRTVSSVPTPPLPPRASPSPTPEERPLQTPPTTRHTAPAEILVSPPEAHHPFHHHPAASSPDLLSGVAPLSPDAANPDLEASLDPLAVAPLRKNLSMSESLLRVRASTDSADKSSVKSGEESSSSGDDGSIGSLGSPGPRAAGPSSPLPSPLAVPTTPTSRVALTPPRSPRPDNSGIRGGGYLYKKGSSGVRRNWKRRWFVLGNGYLYYFESPAKMAKKSLDAGCKGKVALIDARLDPNPPSHHTHKYTFDVVSRKRPLHLYADSQQEKETWCRLIQDDINNARHLGVDAPGGGAVCKECRNTILGMPVSFQTYVYHATCLLCYECERPLGSCEGGIAEGQLYEGRVYCKKDYEVRMMLTCAGCGFQISKSGVAALARQWHEECLVCHQCQARLTPVTVREMEGHAVCAPCEEIGPQIDEVTGGPARGGAKDDKGIDSARVIATLLSRALSISLPADDPPSGTELSVKEYKETTVINEERDGIAYSFEDYAPKVFASIRKRFNVCAGDYRSSICGDPLRGGDTGEGKSGMRFFSTADKKYIIKTMHADELPFFMKNLPEYRDHLAKHPSTLLPRYLGICKIKIAGGKVLRLLVMNNVFLTKRRVHEKYDLKGSTLGRYVSPDEIAKGTTVLKDLNFKRKMRLRPELRVRLVEDLRAATRFLSQQNMMDYSFLLGIHTPGGPKGDYIDGPDMHCDYVSVWQEDEGGVRGQDGETYYFGIIDILQEYNVRKKLERAYKSRTVADPYAISAVDAATYAERFCHYIESLIE